MSAFRYCENEDCSAAMDKPTPYEDLIEGQKCLQCGKLHFNHFTMKDWIIDLHYEIQELKKPA